ncbi:MAG: NmrA family NAD(P)-binding protein [Bacteroidota bacterium]
MKKKILITLAAGKTGFATASQLLEEGYPVRIFVRRLDYNALLLKEKGAEVVFGTFDNETALREALEGVDSVYYCYPYKSGLPKDVALFIKIAKDAHIQSVVFMGQRIAERADTGSRLTDDIRTAYKLLEQSGLNVVYFAPGYFADNIFVVTEMVLQLGLMPNLYGKGKNPWISIGDMARCIVALLKNPEPYYGKKLFPTGPKSISSNEIATIFSKIKGKKVWMFDIPEWMYLKSGIQIGKEYGFDKFAVVQGAFYNRAMKKNQFDMEPTQLVKELTGKEPEDFETIASDYFSKSKYKERNFKNWWNAFVRFNTLPFVKIPGKQERMQINEG